MVTTALFGFVGFLVFPDHSKVHIYGTCSIEYLGLVMICKDTRMAYDLDKCSMDVDMDLLSRSEPVDCKLVCGDDEVGGSSCCTRMHVFH
jgi:hypothetical protein